MEELVHAVTKLLGDVGGWYTIPILSFRFETMLRKQEEAGSTVASSSKLLGALKWIVYFLLLAFW